MRQLDDGIASQIDSWSFDPHAIDRWECPRTLTPTTAVANIASKLAVYIRRRANPA